MLDTNNLTDECVCQDICIGYLVKEESGNSIQIKNVKLLQAHERDTYSSYY